MARLESKPTVITLRRMDVVDIHYRGLGGIGGSKLIGLIGSIRVNRGGCGLLWLAVGDTSAGHDDQILPRAPLQTRYVSLAAFTTCLDATTYLRTEFGAMRSLFRQSMISSRLGD